MIAALGSPLFELDADAIRAAKPDVIITQGLCEVCAVSEGEVRDIAASITPVPEIVSLDATRFDEVLASIEAIARAIGVADEGLELVSGIRVRLRQIHDRLKREKAPRPRVAIIEWTDPLYTAGHWVPDMVRRAGGVDAVAAGGVHSTRCTPDELRAASPDVVIVAACGYDLARSSNEGVQLLARTDLPWLQERRVWAIDGNTLTSRPGPRLCSGVEVLSRILHPALFDAPNLEVARQLTPH